MPKNKGIYRVFRSKEEFEKYNKEQRHFTQIFVLDHVTVALGRMGFREAKFKEFDKVLSEVYKEYAEHYKEDLKTDPEMVYSMSLLDRELKQYTGKMFAPREERYK